MYNIDIHNATPDHIKSIIDVAITAYNDHYTHLWIDGGRSYVNESFNNEAFSCYLDPSCNKSLYFIIQKGKMIGFLTLGFGYDDVGEFRSDYMELERIYIVKEATGRGIGKEVIKFVESTGRKNGYRYIWLKAMKKSRAVSFYQKHGWKIKGETCLDHPQVIPTESLMYVMVKKYNHLQG